jgi:rhodanese-related sulfurtransferase
MKQFLFSALFAATVLLGQQQGTKAPAAEAKKEAAFQAKVLSRAEVDALLAKPDQVLLIDVRRPDEIKDIGGFPVYLSVQVGDVEKSLGWIPKNRTIVTVSNHANRAGRVADILTKNGFKVAGAAGVEDYEAQGGTLTKIASPPPAATKK